MAGETAFENGRISVFKGLVTLTLDLVILHTIVHHSSNSTYTPNFTEIKATFCDRTDVRTYIRTFETGFIRSTPSKSRPNNGHLVLNRFYGVCSPSWTAVRLTYQAGTCVYVTSLLHNLHWLKLPEKIDLWLCMLTYSTPTEWHLNICSRQFILSPSPIMTT